MKSSMSYFRTSYILTALALVAGYLMGGAKGALIVGLLALLEISLSFDNAVVNATVLKDMDAVWRRRFLVWGMLIAVFGMRVLFPLLIVGVVADLGPVAVIDLAANRPDEYAQVITSAHHQIAAFGGAFLLMVFLKFFVDAHKDEHWLSFIEAPLTRLGRLEAAEVAITLVTLVVVGSFLTDGAKHIEFLVAGAWGLVAYIVADGLGAVLGGEEGSNNGAPVAAKTGFAGFMYLELLDASFSFDGVIGAFALTTNLAVIAIGLGVGAMFVRSMTIYLVDKGTLATYRYLEHGAFWAIGVLAALMFAGVHAHIPEVVTGVLGAALIAWAFVSSLKANKLDAAESQREGD